MPKKLVWIKAIDTGVQLHQVSACQARTVMGGIWWRNYQAYDQCKSVKIARGLQQTLDNNKSKRDEEWRSLPKQVR